jgi:hypothetical protein
MISEDSSLQLPDDRPPFVGSRGNLLLDAHLISFLVRIGYRNDTLDRHLSLSPMPILCVYSFGGNGVPLAIEDFLALFRPAGCANRISVIGVVCDLAEVRSIIACLVKNGMDLPNEG